MKMPKCPWCGSEASVNLKTPDYGYGYGAEFACYACFYDGRRFTTHDLDEVEAAVGRNASSESRAVSRANALAMRKAEPKDEKGTA